MSTAVYAYLVFFHRLEQSALRFRAGPVNLISQHYLAKHRALMKFKFALPGIVNINPQHISWEQIGGKLDAGKV